MTWNPSGPGGTAFGLEWPAVRDVPTTLTTDSGLLVPRLTSSITEDITSESIWAEISGSPQAILEVGDEQWAESAGVARTGDRTTRPYALPNATVSAGSFSAVGAPSLWEAIDDGTSYSESDYITATGSSPCRFRLNTAVTPSAGPMWSGRRIVGFGVSWFAASPYVFFPFAGGTLIPELDLFGITVSGTSQFVPAGSTTGQASALSYWPFHPVTGAPWRISDIERLASADAFGFRWIGAWGAFIACTVRIFAVYPFVTWVDETRAAVGQSVLTGAGPSWRLFDLDTPDYYNMLTPQQASLEAVGTAGWLALANCTIARSTAFADTGAASLRITSTGAGALQAGLGSDPVETPRVIPGRTYAMRARIRPVTTTRSCRVSINWCDEAGTVLSTSDGGSVAEGAGVFTTLSVVAAAPAGAAHAYGFVTVLGVAGAGESHDVDGIMLTPETVPSTFIAGGAPRGGFYEKRSGKSYVRSLRRFNSGGSIKVPALSADLVPCPHVGWGNYRSATVKTINGRGDGGVIDDLGAVSLDAAGVLLTTTGGPVSLDSQSYAEFSSTAGAVYSANTIRQEFTAPASASLAIVQLVLSLSEDTTSGFGDLLVKIKRVSDNLQFGGTATIPASSITGTKTVKRILLSTMASAGALVSGTQYYFEISSPTTSAPKFWYVGPALYTAGQGNVANFGGSLGTPDNYTDPLPGFADSPNHDLFAVLSTQPAAIGSLTVTNVTPVGTTIHALRATWTAPVPPTGFARYVLERDDGLGAGFVPIFSTTDVSVLSYDDPHARLNVATTYRIQWFRSDGAGSAYRTASPATRTGTGCKYEIVRGGVDPALWVHADDAWSDGDREYEIDDGDPAKERLFDTDTTLVSRRTERYGDTFVIELGLYGGTQAPLPANLNPRTAFDQIFALVDAATDFLVVHDSDGNRWYCAIDLSNARVHQPGDFVAIDAEVTELDPDFVESA